VQEFFIERETLSGPVADLAFSTDPEQRYLFSADGANSEVYILSRQDGRKLASFGRPGRQAGEFRGIHNIAMDSKGNLYTAEVGYGRRLQRFTPQ
jgi:sugar lactone lactonase YvrE